MKTKYSKPQLVLRTYAQAVNKMQAAYLVVMAFAQAVIGETKGTADERKTQVVALFEAALTGLENARDTLRVYLGDAIMIALKPEITVMVKPDGAKIGDKATQEISVKKIRKYADVRKLAAAAREQIPGSKPKTGGAQKQETPAPVETVKTHVQKMLAVAEGQAMLQKWAGEVGVWIDFRKAEVKTEVAPEAKATPVPAKQPKQRAARK